jgi:hypothetical protein
LNTAQIGALGYDRPSFRLAPKDADFKMTTVTLLSAGDALDTGLMKNAFGLRWVTGDEARLHPEADLILCFR